MIWSSAVVSSVGEARGLPLAGLRGAVMGLLSLFALASVPATDGGVPAIDLIANSCLDCHDDLVQKGNLRLDTLESILDDPSSEEMWLRIYDRVEAGEMPPKKKAFSAEEIEEFTTALGSELQQHDSEKQRSDGRVILRRLSASEYENVVRDLLALPHLTVQQYVPADTEYHGIKNVADRQQLAYNQIAQYLKAAEASLQAAMTLRQRPKTETKRYEPTKLSAHRKFFPGARVIADNKLALIKEPVEAQGPWGLFTSPREPGFYTIRLRAHSARIEQSAFAEEPASPPTLLPGEKDQSVALGVSLGRFLDSFDLTAKPATYETTVWLHGAERLRIHCADLPFRDTKFVQGKKPEIWDAVAIEWAEIEGPLVEDWPPAGHEMLFGDLPQTKWTPKSGFLPPRDILLGTGAVRGLHRARGGPYMVESKAPAEDSERLLRRFMERAYRRPVSEPEVRQMQTRVMDALKQNICFQDAMLIAYKAILCSPDFLFITEQPGSLSGNELATRLALYFWRSLPDDQLIKLGRSDELKDPAVLRAQAKRLLRHPKGQRFVDDFTD
ncbi:MAG: DUF1592 domain-containing protein, partial [Verrucomicrobiota bacterium]